jgi:hypothetical protein
VIAGSTPPGWPTCKLHDGLPQRIESDLCILQR